MKTKFAILNILFKHGGLLLHNIAFSMHDVTPEIFYDLPSWLIAQH
jgi:hypothetical protein